MQSDVLKHFTCSNIHIIQLLLNEKKANQTTILLKRLIRVSSCLGFVQGRIYDLDNIVIWATTAK